MEPKKRTSYWIVGIIIILLIIGGIYWFSNRGEEVAVNYSIESVEVVKPNFVVRSNNLVSVELWAIPTGTGVSESDYSLIGRGDLKSPRGDNPQEWVVPIPQTPMLVSEIFAKGLDSAGNEVARKSLNVSGATSLYEAIWGVVQEEDITLKVGETRKFETLDITLNRVTQDSRCPASVNCIQAGNVTAEFKLVSNGTEQTVTIDSDDPDPLSFGDYFINIKEVRPTKEQPGDIAQSAYEIIVTVSRNLKL